MIRTLAAALATTTCLVAFATPAAAQSRNFNIPAGSLRAALDAFARQSGRQVIYRGDEVRSAKSSGVRGTYTAEDALDTLLAGTGFAVRKDPSGAFAIVKEGNASTATDRVVSPEGSDGSSGQDVVVTGTRIRGVPPSSPVVVLTEQSIRDQGLSSVADAIRALPENFSGGQNPAVQGSSGGIVNQNLTGSSSANLRGVGPDATLTLLNGRRLAYDSFSQAVDLSAIPLAAIREVQVVPDGASAVYGSDAVAGVVNVILKKDYDGLDTSVRYGGATDGGNRQFQLNATYGRTWGTGGFVATFNRERDTPIYSDQRSYAAYMPAPNTLLASVKAQGGILSVHQDLTPSVHFSLDALYSDRVNEQVFTRTTRGFISATTRSYSVSPTLSFDLPGNWAASINGLYGRSETDRNQSVYTLAGALTQSSTACYCNGIKGIEVGAEGPLIRLPGGMMRLALGGGYRYSQFSNPTSTSTFSNPPSTSTTTSSYSRHSYYAFGELNAPLVSPDQNVPLVRSLSLNGSVRYERYNDVGDIATPKLGLVWSPFADFEVKSSWGKSFKAPTLLQLHQGTVVQAELASFFGGSPPPGATVLYVGGGNPNLKPERATNFTAGLGWKPRAVPGLRLNLNYFHIDYNQRVVQPFTTPNRALSEAGLAQFLILNPTAAQQAALLSTAGTFFDNVGGYDPAKVYAIINNFYANAARVSIGGVDVSGSYTNDLAGGKVTLSGSASWLHSRQIVSPTAPPVPTAGKVFTPPRFRFRGGISWAGGGFTLSSFVSGQSSVYNDIIAPFGDISAPTSVDLAIAYNTGEAEGVLRDIRISLAVQNLFNEGPAFLPRRLQNFLVNYDSTNSSPVGRFVGLTVAKHW